MSNGNDLNLLPGGHTHSVANLDFGDTHTISRILSGTSAKAFEPDAISEVRQRLAHSATAVFSRVREKLPERKYQVSTGLMFDTRNRLHVCAVIERVK